TYEGATLLGVNFEKVKMQETIFKDTRIISTNFGNSDLRNANFEGAWLAGNNFNNAKLDGVYRPSGGFEKFGYIVDGKGYLTIITNTK
ncbi:MAG: pentapeptide repeat-containing protein, partial [Proteobacteria bacterium]|nr:pentapeptide repeat-containing protein [Pseudomonadota bacterium]